MAVRRPIILNIVLGSANLYELNDAQIQYIINNTADDAYNNFLATTLSVATFGGNLSGLPMADTRYQAGSSTSRIDRFATEAETPDISIVTINYSRISQTIASPSIPADTNNLRWPVYLDGSGNIRAMTSTDFYDTFVVPALTRINTASSINDYIISTSTSVAGHTLISGTPVFIDTRADTGAYTGGGIGETQDQPTVITSYYLHRNTGTAILDDDNNVLPLYINAGNEQLYEFTVAQWRNTLGPWLQYSMSQTGSRESYSINGTGTTMGTIMLNTRLSPTSSGYTQLFVNDDDYRTQEFPNGSVITANTYELKKTTV